MATRNQLNVSLSGTTGSGSYVGSTSPTLTSATLITPDLGTPSSGTLTNCSNFSWGTQAGAPLIMKYASGVLSANQIKALSATPVIAIAAPGVKKAIAVFYIACYYIYSAPAYTAAASQTIRFRYNNAAAPSIYNTLFSNSTLIGTSNAVVLGPALVIGSSPFVDDLPVAFVNSTATEVTDGNSYINWFITYAVIDLNASSS